jgi:hypothetical protein
LANLGHVVSDQTVGNILRRHGIPPAPKCSQNTSWKDFIAAQMAILAGVTAGESGHAGNRKREVPCATAAQSKSERVR